MRLFADFFVGFLRADRDLFECRRKGASLSRIPHPAANRCREWLPAVRAASERGERDFDPCEPEIPMILRPLPDNLGPLPRMPRRYPAAAAYRRGMQAIRGRRSAASPRRGKFRSLQAACGGIC